MDMLRVTRVGLGLLGVLAAVQGVVAFPSLTGTAAVVARAYGTATAVFAVLLPFVFIWFVSYYLVFNNLTLATHISRSLHGTPNAENPPLTIIVVGLVGILILAYSLNGVITTVAVIIAQGSMGIGRQFVQIAAAYLAQAALGLFLVLRPHLLVRFWGFQVLPEPGTNTGN